MLAQQMPFGAVWRVVGEAECRVLALCRRYVHIAGSLADYSAVSSLAIDETSRARCRKYVTIATDADERRVIFVGDGRGAQVVAELAKQLDWHGCPPSQIRQVSIDMSAAYIKGVGKHLPNAQITFEKFHVRSSPTPARQWTRRDMSSSAAIPNWARSSRGCDGPCSRMPSASSRRPALRCMP